MFTLMFTLLSIALPAAARLRRRPKSVVLEHKSNSNADNAGLRQRGRASMAGDPHEVGQRPPVATPTGKTARSGRVASPAIGRSKRFTSANDSQHALASLMRT